MELNVAHVQEICKGYRSQMEGSEIENNDYNLKL